MNNVMVTPEQLKKELQKYIPDICRELNRDKDITIKRKSAGRIQLVCQSHKKMN